MSQVAPSDGWFADTTIVHTEASAPHNQLATTAHPEVVSAPKQDNWDDYDYEDPYLSGPQPPNEITNDDSNLPKCDCGLPAARLRSNTTANPNRWFYKCAKFKDDPTACKHFIWEDELFKNPSPSRSRPTNRPRTDAYNPPPVAPTPYHNRQPQQPPVSPGGGVQYQQRDKSSDQCYVCKEYGHWGSECPNKNTNKPAPSAVRPVYQQPAGPSQPSGGGGRDKSGDQCYVCQGYGHWSSECPQKNANKPTNNGGGGYQQNYTTAPYQGGGANANANASTRGGSCFKCGSTDHWARDCPMRNGYNSGGGGGGYNSNAGGQQPYGKRKWDSYTDNTRGNNTGPSYGGGSNYGAARTTDGGKKPGSCFKCGEMGHWTNACPNR